MDNRRWAVGIKGVAILTAILLDPPEGLAAGIVILLVEQAVDFLKELALIHIGRRLEAKK